MMTIDTMKPKKDPGDTSTARNRSW